jgi:2-desacetyl-2-hydroxyethyl bacteriochlorophyllide A dehydrogenase
MQAVVFPAPETLAVESVADPTCRPDDVVVRVAASGICGTDLHIFRNEYMSDFPVIPGHEFGGTVVEIGKDVTDLKVGDRVAVDPNLYCGHCYFCRNEQANHCLNWQGVGVTRPGAFAEYVAAPARAAYKIPDSLSDAQAAFIEPVSCVVHALKRLRVLPGDEVLIFGAGPMGLIMLQALRHSGASQVVIVEKQPQRLALARQLGASAAVTPGPDLSAALRERAPYGYPIVVDCTGVPAVIESEFQYLKPRGQFLQFGVVPREAKIQISPYDLFQHDWTIVGSFALCYTFIPAIAWLAGGVVDVNPLISHSVPMTEFPKVFQEFAAGQTLKVQVRPGGE